MDFTSINTPKINGQAKKYFFLENVPWCLSQRASRIQFSSWSTIPSNLDVKSEKLLSILSSVPKNGFKIVAMKTVAVKMLHADIMFTWKVFVEQVS